MAGEDGTYSVDSDELADLVAELVDCRARLDRNVTDLRKQMAVLRGEWEGLSADAQALASAELEKGLDAMNLALADLIAANEMAHGNYTAAWEANLAMWQALQ